MHIRTLFPLEDVVDRAFECVHWEGAGDEHVEAFASHWGGLDLEHFRLALEKEGEDYEERMLAIFALGLTATAEAANLIAPFLDLAPCGERSASALCLGLMKDPRAYPVLESLLLDGLDLEQYILAYQEDNQDLIVKLIWSGVFRWHALYLLEDWETPSLVPTLKHAFTALWRVQQRLHPYGFEVENYDALAYALGQRGDLTVLHDLDLPPEHRNTALIYLALGHLQAKAAPSSGGLTGLPNPISAELQREMITNDLLKQAVAIELALHFGLSPEEQDDCIRHFYESAQLRRTYGNPDSSTYFDASDEELDEDNQDQNEKEEPEPVASFPLCVYHDHTARIQSLSWSPESTHLVSGSEDGTARVWDSATGETVTVFRGHTASVNLVSWSPQGHLIASGGSDRIVSIWDAWTGQEINRYRGHTSWIWGGLVWSPDGTKIASASLDRTVQVWNAVSGEQMLTYRGHTGIIASMAWSPDGTRIVSGGGYPECEIQIWDVQTGALQLTYRDHQRDDHKQRPLFGPMVQQHDEYVENWLREASSVHGLAWSPNGMWIASAGLRLVCRVWDAHSGENIVTSDRTDGPLVWSPDSMFLASHDSIHQVDLWHATTNEIAVSYLTLAMREIKALAWSPDGRYLAGGGKETGIYDKAIIQVWKHGVDLS